MSATNTVAGVAPERRAWLESGAVPAATLTEALAIDQSQLMRNVLPNAPATLQREVDAASKLGILARMGAIGAALNAHLDPHEFRGLATHPSDTVRGWVCFATAVSSEARAVEHLLQRLRTFADDEHFAVREWVWMAARPSLTAHLEESIMILSAWVREDSERLRRFACEATRPRGVWAKHIAELKAHPEQGTPILEPLRSDPSRYVQDSVANWINDAAKNRPDWAMSICDRWRSESPTPHTERIVTRGLRSLPMRRGS